MHMWESVKEIQYNCGRLDFRHVVDKHMVHFFGNIHKTNNVVVQRCFSNFKRGDTIRYDTIQYNTINVLVPSLQNMADCALQCQ